MQSVKKLKSLKNRYARASALVGGGLAGLVLVIVSWAFLNPLEWAELKSRYELRSHSGAKTLELRGLIGMTKLLNQENQTQACFFFIHGSGDSLTTWKRLIRLLPGDVRWLAIDLPGQGGNRKERDSEKYRVTQTAERIWGGIGEDPFLTRECPKYQIIANSFGGWIAIRLALLQPSRVEKIVLLGGVGLEKPELPKLAIFSDPTIEALKDFQAKAYYKPRELPDSIWEAALERSKKSEVPKIREAQKPADHLDGVLRTVQVPIVYVWGEADRIVTREYASTLTSQIPGAKFVTIPRCGHMPQKECPEELWTRIRNE